METKCPLCRGELEYRVTPTRETHVQGFKVHQQGETQTRTWSCRECYFVGFEYHGEKDIEALKRIIT